MSKVKPGDIYRNNCSTMLCYFLVTGFSTLRQVDIATGYNLYITKENIFEKGMYYLKDLGDENFPKIGHIDVKELENMVCTRITKEIEDLIDDI